MKPGLLLLLTTCVACAPPKADAPVAPEAPVLSLEALSHHWTTTLTGVAPEGTVVRLYFDTSCTGAAFTQVSAEALALGIDLALVRGVPNVVTGDAVGPTGLASACSAPVSTLLEGVEEVAAPTNLTVTPRSPARTTSFRLRGDAVAGARVRLHVASCSFPAQDELSAEDFSTTGFQVELRADEVVSYLFDAIDPRGEQSVCSSPLWVESDQTGPRYASLRFLSPNPSPQTLAWARAEGDFVQAQFVTAAGCAGAPELKPDAGAGCTSRFGGCEQRLLEFPADASTAWSLDAVDALGNHSCFEAFTRWVHDPSLPPQPVTLAGGSGVIDLFAPGDLPTIVFFESEDCSPPVRGEWATSDIIGGQFSLHASDGGPLTARGAYFSGDVSQPCSNVFR